jgi:hypothetical protein
MYTALNDTSYEIESSIHENEGGPQGVKVRVVVCGLVSCKCKVRLTSDHNRLVMGPNLP